MTTEHGDGRDLGRSLKLLWGDTTRPPRGRPPALSLDRVITAAVEVADELARTEGLDALSMRSIATRLGVGTMSLYRYVPGKSELLDLMLDHVIGVPDEDEDAEGGWREIFAAEAHRHWRLCLDHPWYPFVDQSRPLLGPNAMRGLDVLIAKLRPIGVDDRTLLMMISTQSDYVEGVARRYINEIRAEARGREQRGVLVRPGTDHRHRPEQRRLPTMADLADNTFDFSYEQVFEFGLTRLHDGFATFIDARAVTRIASRPR